MLEHGGQLRAAAAHYQIPLADWLDLSTGINPQGWSVPALPPEVWQRLPEENDGLEAAAAAYYGNADSLVVAGSQAAIQWLPALLPRAAIACLAPLYNEHTQAWQRAGHRVRLLQNANLQRALAASTPYVLLCNPNNPTARHYAPDELLAAAAQLKQRGGWLIVDEAFVETAPELSIAAAATPRTIVLRSFGKFYGLAGVRLGFAIAEPGLAARIGAQFGDWPVSAEAIAAGVAAYGDLAWAERTRARLAREAQRLDHLLVRTGFEIVGGTALFRLAAASDAPRRFVALARLGVLARPFSDQPTWLRFGLPKPKDWPRLAAALEASAR